MQQDVLLVAGLYDETRPVSEQFQAIEMRFVDLETGEFVADGTIDPRKYDAKVAAQGPAAGGGHRPRRRLGGFEVSGEGSRRSMWSRGTMGRSSK